MGPSYELQFIKKKKRFSMGCSILHDLSRWSRMSSMSSSVDICFSLVLSMDCWEIPAQLWSLSWTVRDFLLQHVEHLLIPWPWYSQDCISHFFSSTLIACAPFCFFLNVFFLRWHQHSCWFQLWPEMGLLDRNQLCLSQGNPWSLLVRPPLETPTALDLQQV